MVPKHVAHSRKLKGKKVKKLLCIDSPNKLIIYKGRFQNILQEHMFRKDVLTSKLHVVFPSFGEN
jgi:hypothetical protein